MSYSVPPLDRLVDAFARLPSIGRKTAARLAFYMLTAEKGEAKEFCDAITEAREKIHYCKECQNLTDKEYCSVCSSATRDKGLICVVGEPQDAAALERMREYNGLYHILHGYLSPMKGVGPDDIKLKELVTRLADDTVREVIIATDPTVEGETTASYIARMVKPFGIKVTRLAYGIPVGAELEYADEVTLARAFQGRSEM